MYNEKDGPYERGFYYLEGIMTNKSTVAEIQQGYNVHVTGRHMHVTNAMKEHAVDRLSRLERFGERIIDVTVTMDIQKLEHRVDILMKYGHTVIRSHAVSDDMYVSIDKAVERLEQQLKRYKDRLRNHYAKGYPVVEVPVEVWSAQEESEEESTQAIGARPFVTGAVSSHRIVASETRPLKILSEDEAIMKMELSQDPFMVFRSEKTSRIQVIYRRNDGNYGILQPEG